MARAAGGQADAVRRREERAVGARAADADVPEQRGARLFADADRDGSDEFAGDEQALIARQQGRDAEAIEEVVAEAERARLTLGGAGHHRHHHAGAGGGVALRLRRELFGGARPGDAGDDGAGVGGNLNPAVEYPRHVDDKARVAADAARPEGREARGGLEAEADRQRQLRPVLGQVQVDLADEPQISDGRGVEVEAGAVLVEDERDGQPQLDDLGQRHDGRRVQGEAVADDGVGAVVGLAAERIAAVDADRPDVQAEAADEAVLQEEAVAVAQAGEQRQRPPGVKDYRWYRIGGVGQMRGLGHARAGAAGRAFAAGRRSPADATGAASAGRRTAAGGAGPEAGAGARLCLDGRRAGARRGLRARGGAGRPIGCGMG